MPETADDLFAAVAAEIVRVDPRVASPETERQAGHRFGAAGLKVNGKIFAMVSNGALVFKLPRTRVDALVEAGTGARFDPGHGRVMKEWIVIHPDAAADWNGLATEALAFVGKAPSSAVHR